MFSGKWQMGNIHFLLCNAYCLLFTVKLPVYCLLFCIVYWLLFNVYDGFISFSMREHTEVRNTMPNMEILISDWDTRIPKKLNGIFYCFFLNFIVNC